jgi:hypothetical protein
VEDAMEPSSSETTTTSSSSSSSYGGIFSSVFDVARDTLSALNGGGSHYTSYRSNDETYGDQHKPCKATSLHLVDTLYLF